MKIVCRKDYITDVLRRRYENDQIVNDFDPETEILIAEPGEMVENILKQMPELKLCICSRDGYDKADLNYLKDNEIILCNAHGLFSEAIGEFIVMRVLEYASNSYRYSSNQYIKRYEVVNGRKLLNELTIGFIGCGSIASKAAIMLKKLGCRTLGYKRTYSEKIEGFDELYYEGHLNELLGKSDVIVAAVDLNPSTRYIINEKTLSLMKDGAGFINIARGAIVKTDDLIDAIEYGKIAYAALDVFEEEPLNEDSRLWDYPQIRISPHCAGIYDRNHKAFSDLAVQIIEQYMNKEELSNRVL